jgi:hypothetical protein
VEVLVLGSYHFANPGLDIAKFAVADVLTPGKQAEIARIVEALARFRPTKIAVEVVPERQERSDSIYRAFAEGRHTLARDEREQIGFRLAKQFSHPRVYAIDYRGAFPMNAVMEYAAQKDTAFMTRFQATIRRVQDEASEMQRTMSIGEILLKENDRVRIADGHALYLEISRVGSAEVPVGTNLLSAWYDRNIRIFGNLARVGQPGDRILVIFGAGHLRILQELIRGTPGFRLVEAATFIR